MEKNTESRTSQPTPDTAVRALDAFVGKWVGDASMVNMTATTEESYDWLPGDFFLIYRGCMDYGQKLDSTRILGYDASNRQYYMQAFDSMGYNRIYKGTLCDGVWKFTGEFERVKIVFSDDGNTTITNWERAEDGWDWKHLCEIKATRIT